MFNNDLLTFVIYSAGCGFGLYVCTSLVGYAVLQLVNIIKS